jgi:hypothetical protein
MNPPPPDNDPGRGNGWTMGLRGAWATVANLTAIALICVLFYQSEQESRRLAREDRELFRQELQRLHEDSRRHSEAIQLLTESVKLLAEDVRALKINRGKP